MHGLLKKLSDRLRGRAASASLPDREGAEAARAAFSERYQAFKRLISANNTALETMAAMETALTGTRPYTVVDIQAQVTRTGTAVRRMVRELEALAPGRYPALADRVEEIRRSLSEILAPPLRPRDGPVVLPLSEITLAHTPSVGRKAAVLGELRRAGIPVPEGFAVTAAGFDLFFDQSGLREEISRRIQTADRGSLDGMYRLSAALRGLIAGTPLPPALETALNDAVAEFGSTRLAVRSSAVGEDEAGASMAGLHESQLNVHPENIASAWRDVVASLYTVQAMTYRLHRGIPGFDAVMPVCILAMAEASAGGVAYTSDPSGDHEGTAVLVHAVPGLPGPVVDGHGNPDVFHICGTPPHEVLHKDISLKSVRYDAREGEGIARKELAESERAVPAVSDRTASEIGALAVRIEKLFTAPQDVEWAVDKNGEITVLQARALPGLAHRNTGSSEQEGACEAVSAGAPNYKTTVTARADIPENAAPIFSGGVCASAGSGAGPVHAVSRDAEALAFPEGGILVLKRPEPRRAALLGRASAVVAAEGGMAGHLAGVAREFGIPALFGVGQENLSLLADRSEATVVVQNGSSAVYGEAYSLIQETAASSPLDGSPVQRMLRQIVETACPLHLTDPESPSFRPESCRSLHDISRFCHEKAVEAMFLAGHSASFPRHAARRLYCEVPMQFWVLDLDDGIAPPPSGETERATDCIGIDRVISQPMLDLWRGMTAIPWGGPPPVDARGLLSVVMESAMNPGLLPEVHSSSVQRNYFMVARKFCSLQSRFGYHFTTVEAIAGDYPAENYAAFRFHGGAADISRRVRRLNFVSHILEEHGFRPIIRGETLTARLEGAPLPEMTRALRVLGYLVMHTRQLDMVMADAGAVTRLYEKFRTDLEAILTDSI